VTLTAEKERTQDLADKGKINGPSNPKYKMEVKHVSQNGIKQTQTYLIQNLPPKKPTNLQRKVTAKVERAALHSNWSQTILY
jgi:hypothetical protein